MRWVDVAGAPAVGKSAILDHEWPRRVPDDGGGLPADWRSTFDCALGLCGCGVEPDECRRLVEVTFAKMATVSRRDDPGVYVQTGLAQIGLELGWRLSSPEQAARFYEMMPVSLGVAFLFADVEMVQSRNRLRSRNFEDRIPAMDAARETGGRVLDARGVPLVMIDTRFNMEISRAKLRCFAQSLT